jgi:hypothetical protein
MIFVIPVIAMAMLFRCMFTLLITHSPLVFLMSFVVMRL